MKKLVPVHSRLPLILVLAWNFTVYYGARFLTSGRTHYDLSLPFEEKIPLIPWTVLIYFGCYIFWGVNYILGAYNSKEEAWRFALADMFGKAVCLVFYLAMPTTLVRPEIVDEGLMNDIMRYLYMTDAADNLFPSIHCLVSWMSYIGVRKNPIVKPWYRVVSLIIALAVCVSTLTTKQHVFLDTISGVALAELGYYISGKITKKWGKPVDESRTETAVNE